MTVSFGYGRWRKVEGGSTKFARGVIAAGGTRSRDADPLDEKPHRPWLVPKEDEL